MAGKCSSLGLSGNVKNEFPCHLCYVIYPYLFCYYIENILSFFRLILAQSANSAKKRPLCALAATATAAHDAGGPFSPGFRAYASAGMKKEDF
jgi:hypothetical protein